MSEADVFFQLFTTSLKQNVPENGHDDFIGYIIYSDLRKAKNQKKFRF